MAGGGDDVPQQQATAEEKEATRIAEEQWRFYEQYGKPTARKYAEAVTGFTTDAQGNLVVGENQRVRNRDGSIRTDASSALAGTTKAYAPKMQAFDQNSGQYRGGLTDLATAQIRTGAEAAGGMMLGQQNRALKGLENNIALGRGQQIGAVKGLHELAAGANAKAAQDANNAFANQSANRYLAGQVIGGLTSYAGNKGYIPGLQDLG